MKTVRQIALSLTVLTLGCNPTEERDMLRSTDSTSTEIVTVQDKTAREDLMESSSIKTDMLKDFDEFEACYEYADERRNIKQTLGVTWLTSDSIEYRLKTKENKCESDYVGHAKNKYPDLDPEIDEDEEGLAYPSLQYDVINDNFSLAIRIALDKDKAQFICSNNRVENSNCMPTQKLVLVTKTPANSR